jgi:hypothetical protein
MKNFCSAGHIKLTKVQKEAKMRSKFDTSAYYINEDMMNLIGVFFASSIFQKFGIWSSEKIFYLITILVLCNSGIQRFKQTYDICASHIKVE